MRGLSASINIVQDKSCELKIFPVRHLEGDGDIRHFRALKFPGRFVAYVFLDRRYKLIKTKAGGFFSGRGPGNGIFEYFFLIFGLMFLKNMENG